MKRSIFASEVVLRHDPEPVWASYLNYAVGFATVFPGLFETAALLASWGMFQHWRTPSFVVAPRLLGIILVSGLLATVLPLLWPLLFFPLIWMSMALLWEPLVYRWEGRSLLAELARGDPRRVAILLTAGAINGGLWEGWNVLTRTGWIYTAPWLDWFHVFEMPLAGYLGFPLLAVECAVLWSVLDRCHLTGATPTASPTAQSLFPHGRLLVSVVIALVWIVLVFAGIDRWIRPPPYADSRTSRHHCARDCRVRDRWTSLSLRTGPRDQAAGIGTGRHRVTTFVTACAGLVDASSLSEFRGVGLRNLRLLQAAGITRIEELAAQEEVLPEKHGRITCVSTHLSHMYHSKLPTAAVLWFCHS